METSFEFLQNNCKAWQKTKITSSSRFPSSSMFIYFVKSSKDIEWIKKQYVSGMDISPSTMMVSSHSELLPFFKSYWTPCIIVLLVALIAVDIAARHNSMLILPDIAFSWESINTHPLDIMLKDYVCFAEDTLLQGLLTTTFHTKS